MERVAGHPLQVHNHIIIKKHLPVKPGGIKSPCGWFDVSEHGWIHRSPNKEGEK